MTRAASRWTVANTTSYRICHRACVNAYECIKKTEHKSNVLECTRILLTTDTGEQCLRLPGDYHHTRDLSIRMTALYLVCVIIGIRVCLKKAALYKRRTR